MFFSYFLSPVINCIVLSSITWFIHLVTPLAGEVLGLIVTSCQIRNAVGMVLPIGGDGMPLFLNYQVWLTLSHVHAAGVLYWWEVLSWLGWAAGQTPHYSSWSSVNFPQQQIQICYQPHIQEEAAANSIHSGLLNSAWSGLWLCSPGLRQCSWVHLLLWLVHQWCPLS